MKRRGLFILSFVVVLGTALVFPSIVHQAGTEPALVGDADPAVESILQRSCQDCHSERTHWPWYAHIPPASSLVQHDVSVARSHMNLSHWDQYDSDEKQQLLKQIRAVVRSRMMPPGRYLLMHPDARLSDEEARRLEQWAKDERHRLAH